RGGRMRPGVPCSASGGWFFGFLGSYIRIEFRKQYRHEIGVSGRCQFTQRYHAVGVQRVGASEDGFQYNGRTRQLQKPGGTNRLQEKVTAGRVVGGQWLAGFQGLAPPRFELAQSFVERVIE